VLVVAISGLLGGKGMFPTYQQLIGNGGKSHIECPVQRICPAQKYGGSKLFSVVYSGPKKIQAASFI
jgi:hypothetical protein